MNKALAMKWVKALRSGKYKQGKQFLKRNNKYCCLGVLCEIDNNEVGSHHTTLGSVYNDDELPLTSYIGRKKDATNIKINDTLYDNLAEANDMGVSFKNIANWIEKNYKKL